MAHPRSVQTEQQIDDMIRSHLEVPVFDEVNRYPDRSRSCVAFVYVQDRTLSMLSRLGANESKSGGIEFQAETDILLVALRKQLDGYAQ